MTTTIERPAEPASATPVSPMREYAHALIAQLKEDYPNVVAFDGTDSPGATCVFLAFVSMYNGDYPDIGNENAFRIWDMNDDGHFQEAYQFLEDILAGEEVTS